MAKRLGSLRNPLSRQAHIEPPRNGGLNPAGAAKSIAARVSNPLARRPVKQR